MRFLLNLLLSLGITSILSGNETPKLKISIITPTNKIHLNEAPVVLVRISNQSKRTIYFEYESLQISSGVTYPDRTSELSGTTGRVLSGASDGASVSGSLFGRNTLGIEPGQSFLKVTQLPRIKRLGEVILSVWLHVPVTSALEVKTSEWEEVSSEAEIKININK